MSKCEQTKKLWDSFKAFYMCTYTICLSVYNYSTQLSASNETKDPV